MNKQAKTKPSSLKIRFYFLLFNSRTIPVFVSFYCKFYKKFLPFVANSNPIDYFSTQLGNQLLNLSLDKNAQPFNRFTSAFSF